MKLYGTTTSPFVRRVRIVAAEVGEPIDRVDTATDAGMAALREVSPIRKVPVAIVDGHTLFDSRVIIEYLTSTRGFGGITVPGDRWLEHNLVNAIDAALDSAIQLFYLKRDGVAAAGSAFETRQLERIDAIFAWLADRLSTTSFGLAEASLVCALDWMDFRAAYPTARAGALGRIRSAWAERPSVSATRPGV